MLEQLKTRARALKTEPHAVYLAALDPRTPWYTKALLLLIVAYVLSPIDLIPDFIPVLGYLDDLILVPAGIALAVQLIPAEAMARARTMADQAGESTRIGMAGAVIIALIWILVILAVVARFRQWAGARNNPQ